MAKLTPTIEVKPLALHIGAEISGVDLGRPLEVATRKAINDALLRWKVVFFRNQPLGHAEQIAFAARFGEVTYAHPHEDEPIDGHPEILAIDSRRYDRRYGKRFSYENRWHTDVTAAVNPPAASILRAHILPPYGGDTTWTNLVAAYEGLSAPLRARASRIARQMRSGVVGISTWRTPNSASASTTAFTATASAGVVPPSPAGRMPSGWVVDGTSLMCVTKFGK